MDFFCRVLAKQGLNLVNQTKSRLYRVINSLKKQFRFVINVMPLIRPLRAVLGLGLKFIFIFRY